MRRTSGEQLRDHALQLTHSNIKCDAVASTAEAGTIRDHLHPCTRNSTRISVNEDKNRDTDQPCPLWPHLAPHCVHVSCDRGAGLSYHTKTRSATLTKSNAAISPRPTTSSCKEELEGFWLHWNHARSLFRCATCCLNHVSSTRKRIQH